MKDLPYLVYNAFLISGAIHLYSKGWSGWWVVLAICLMTGSGK